MKPALVPATLFLGLVSAFAGHGPQGEANVTRAAPLALNNATSPSVPGRMDFYPCKGFSLDDNIFNITEVTLDPNPPKKKRDVRVVVRGHMRETIEPGAYVKVTLKKGILKHTLNFDFCKGIEAGCPVPAGDAEFWTGQYISAIIPHGKAKAKIRAYTKDKRIMSCIEVPVTLKE